MSFPEDSQSSLSLHLSHVLDDIGVDERTVTRRRQTLLTREKIETVYVRLRNRNKSIYHFGSQIEGTTTNGLDSDLDTLICNCEINVIQDISNWKQGRQNYLVLQGEKIPAGYCRVQLMRDDCPEGATDFPNQDEGCFERDDENRILVKNTINFKESLEGSVVHGPSQAIAEPAFVERDNVFSVMCHQWPNQAQKWRSKMESKSWPTTDVVASSLESGFFLVPVGYRLSEARDLEWRVSPSLTERYLMLSLNITQVKCYVMLKMVKTFLITPVIGESISSFHLKTTLFHCIEEKGSGFWIEENLLKCLNLCLCKLLLFLKDRYCPNYLIPEENLFAGKIQEEMIHPLTELIEYILESDGKFLFGITCDQIGRLLEESMSTRLVQPYELSSSSRIMIAYCEAELHKFVSSHVNVVLNCSDVPIKEEQTNDLAQRVECYIQYLNSILNDADAYTGAAAESYLNYMYTVLGTVQGSICISSGEQIPETVFALIDKGVESDLTSGRLKLASVLYCNGDAAKAALVLEDLVKRYNTDSVQPVCGCHEEVSGFRALTAFSELVSCSGNDSERRQLMASCVLFLPQEIYCCPFELRYEMFRGVGDDLQLRTKEDSWMDCAAVDSITYLHYMLFVTYRKLGK